MELLICSLLVMGCIWVFISINFDNEFDRKLKEIEDILNSSEARSRKYELFDMLGKLADDCSNYDQLSKMNKLLGRVYAL